MGFWPVVLNVLRNSDVVLLVLDARMPNIARNSEIVEKVGRMGKQLIYVFNKCDLLGKGDLIKLEREYPSGFLISALKKKGIGKLKKRMEEMADKWIRESFRVGIVGYPNAGKSSLINVLIPGSMLKVKSVSGTTRKTEWIRSGKLRIIDSPGVIPAGDDKIKIGLTASKDPHKIKNPEKVALNIVEFLVQKNSKILERFYKIIIDESASYYDVFFLIGKKKGFLLKGGIVDEDRTAICIINDWQKGKIGLK